MLNLSWERNLPAGAGEMVCLANRGVCPCASWSSGAVPRTQLSGMGSGRKPWLFFPRNWWKTGWWFLLTFLFCICVLTTSASKFAFSPEGFGILAPIHLLSFFPTILPPLSCPSPCSWRALPVESISSLLSLPALSFLSNPPTTTEGQHFTVCLL